MTDLIQLRNPLDAPLHFLALEVVVTACLALTVLHAAGKWRAGERRYLFRWVAIFLYGLTMELIAFHYYQNYVHGKFTVQLYTDLLPLYVTFIYIVFHYTGIELAERLALPWWGRALVAGFAICMLDVPFDTLGVDAGWWTWSADDPVLAERWLGVPITSYEWYLLFGAILAGLCDRLGERTLWLTPVAAVGTFVLGVVAFLPFHGLTALGVPGTAIVAGHMIACALYAARARRSRDIGVVVAVPFSLHGLFAAVMVALWSQGRLDDGGLELVAAGLAAGGLATVIAPGFGRAARAADPIARFRSASR